MNQKQYAELVKRCIKKGQVTETTPLQMPLMQSAKIKKVAAKTNKDDYKLGSDNMKKIFKNLVNNI